MLHVKKLAHQTEYVSLNPKPKWFIKLSPNGQVPLLIAKDQTVLFESQAILEYLDEISPPLNPGLSSEQRAVERAWSAQANALFGLQRGLLLAADESSFKAQQQLINQQLERIGNKLLGDYFQGATLGNVDLAYLPFLFRCDFIAQQTGYDILAQNPKAKAWQTVLNKSQIAQRSIAADFAAEFAAYYLQQDSYIAKLAT